MYKILHVKFIAHIKFKLKQNNSKLMYVKVRISSWLSAEDHQQSLFD